jgi:HK97 family phage prohead protease
MPETAPFAWNFGLERKSVTTDASTGDLIVSGYASTFDVDRMEEAFVPGVWERTLKRFLGTNPQVLWMHKYDVPLGVVEDARVDTKGLWVRCRLDAPAPGSVAEDIVRRIARGTLRTFSVGGRWQRAMTPAGLKIIDADLMEISIASVPVNPNALITSVAQKSFRSADDDLVALRRRIDLMRVESALTRLDRLARTVTR